MACSMEYCTYQLALESLKFVLQLLLVPLSSCLPLMDWLFMGCWAKGKTGGLMSPTREETSQVSSQLSTRKWPNDENWLVATTN